jgi:hypothetical protein
MGGEFGRGTAMQYGEADVEKKDFSNQASGGKGRGSCCRALRISTCAHAHY